MKTKRNKFEYLEQNKKKIIIRVKGFIFEREFLSIEEADKAYFLLAMVYQRQQ